MTCTGKAMCGPPVLQPHLDILQWLLTFQSGFLAAWPAYQLGHCLSTGTRTSASFAIIYSSFTLCQLFNVLTLASYGFFPRNFYSHENNVKTHSVAFHKNSKFGYYINQGYECVKEWNISLHLQSATVNANINVANTISHQGSAPKLTNNSQNQNNYKDYLYFFKHTESLWN